MQVWMFSGQGAQEPGMGEGLMALPEVARVFATGSEILGIDLERLACEAEADEVNDAFNAQALTFAVSVGLGLELRSRNLAPEAFVGFSLGQISALAVSGALSLEDAFTLLKTRCQAMAAACQANPGGMLALMRASVEQAEELCAACIGDDVLVAANHNCPGQVVISGTEPALERAQAAWGEQGGKCVRLNTAGAFHSPLMADAGKALIEVCNTLEFNQPVAPVICNTNAEAFDVAKAGEALAAQVMSPVLFQESIEKLLAEGADSFVEIGHGDVLAKLVKRISRDAQRITIGTIEQLEEFCA